MSKDPEELEGYIKNVIQNAYDVQDTSTPNKVAYPQQTTATQSSFEFNLPTHINLSRTQKREIIRIVNNKKLTDGQKLHAINKIKKQNQIR